MKPKETDEWETPIELFTELQQLYGIDIDLCATVNNTKCKQWVSDILSVPEDFLKGNKAAFMNPPFSNVGPFIKKAWELSKYSKVIVLLPLNTYTAKYMDLLDVNNGEKVFREMHPGVVGWFPLSRRVKFTHPKFNNKSGPSFGCAIAIFDRRFLK